MRPPGSMAGRVAAIVWKDLLIEVRTKASFNSMLAFAGLVLFVFSFAIGPETPLLRRIAAGLLWVAIVVTIWLFRRFDRPAAWLLIPYLAWVSFAGYLNYGIWALN